MVVFSDSSSAKPVVPVIAAATCMINPRFFYPFQVSKYKKSNHAERCNEKSIRPRSWSVQEKVRIIWIVWPYLMDFTCYVCGCFVSLPFIGVKNHLTALHSLLVITAVYIVPLCTERTDLCKATSIATLNTMPPACQPRHNSRTFLLIIFHWYSHRNL